MRVKANGMVISGKHLGKKMTDNVTDLKGVATSMMLNANGCLRYCLEFKKKDGEIAYEWVDEQRLTVNGKLIYKEILPEISNRTGGPTGRETHP